MNATTTMTPAEEAEWAAAVEAGALVKWPDQPVEWRCGFCGALRSLPAGEYRRRMNYSYSGKLFCNNSCSARRQSRKAAVR